MGHTCKQVHRRNQADTTLPCGFPNLKRWYVIGFAMVPLLRPKKLIIKFFGGASGDEPKSFTGDMNLITKSKMEHDFFLRDTC